MLLLWLVLRPNQSTKRNPIVVNSAFLAQGGVVKFLYWILSRVLPGCPASAFLFDCVLDPFLAAFQKQLRSGVGSSAFPAQVGISRACADDFGMACLSLKALTFLKPIFDLAAFVAGLTPKPINKKKHNCCQFRFSGSRRCRQIPLLDFVWSSSRMPGLSLPI